MKKVSVGLIGAGFAAGLHARCIKQVPGIDIEIAAVCDLDRSKAMEFAEEYGIRKVSDDYNELLHDEDIDVAIIVTPPSTHFAIVSDALDANKNVVCEKPLTGYFGTGAEERVGDTVSKKEMYDAVLKELEVLEEKVRSSKKLFMYAENYIYSPNIQKAAEIIRARKSKILFMRGEETVQGSSSPTAGLWKFQGGGTLMRIGSHPIGGILYLKQVEAEARGEEINVVSVVADTGRLSTVLSEYEKRHLLTNPQDVEDFAAVTVTFSDGTKASIFANDNVLGGVNNYVQVYSSDSTMICNITPTDAMETYFADHDNLDDIYISERLSHKTGWNKVFISEMIQRGYVDQMHDFLTCVLEGRKPKSDFRIASEAVRVIYAAYYSAESGERVNLR